MNYRSMIKLVPNRTMLVVIPRIAAVLFILLQILGMQVYPGGTMYNASTEGYSFSMNFFSDSVFLSDAKTCCLILKIDAVFWFRISNARVFSLLSI